MTKCSIVYEFLASVMLVFENVKVDTRMTVFRTTPLTVIHKKNELISQEKQTGSVISYLLLVGVGWGGGGNQYVYGMGQRVLVVGCRCMYQLSAATVSVIFTWQVEQLGTGYLPNWED